MKSNKNIIIALDGISEGEALGIAKLFKGRIWGFKINDLLFDSRIISKLKMSGKVFADAKLHDIPNTVANSVARLSNAGADIITVHASGGVEMMRSAMKKAGKSKILGVTILTSELYKPDSVKKLCRDALKARVDGIVCSGQDLKSVKAIRGSKKLLKIVPGIRPGWYKEKDDQKRIILPEEAFKNGADLIVIGRPILNSKNPV
jgi:orotidine-5'-phosphate decarboxylase